MEIQRNPSPMTKYRPEFCQLLIDHMENGFSFSSFPARIYDDHKVKVGTSTLWEWAKDRPDFAHAYEVAKARALAFHERFLRYHVTGVIPKKLKEEQNMEMDKTTLIFTLKTRFWKEYGDQIKLQGMKDGEPIKVQNSTDLENISSDKLEKILSILKEENSESEST